LLMDSCLIFVPFGHYDEPEILRYANTSICPKGADVRHDDPCKADDATSEAERNRVNQWYRDTAYSRLNDKENDVIVIVMQRIHLDDLVGSVLGLDNWTVLDLPAIATKEYEEIYTSEHTSIERFKGDILHPERESLETLNKIEAIIGSGNFAAQYQQSPIPPDGQVFRKSWIKRYDAAKDLDFSQTIQSWDTALETSAGAAYSVCITVGIRETRAYIRDVYRERLSYPELRHQVVKRAKLFNANRVLIEKAASGHSLLQDLGNSSALNLIPITPKLDKETRAHQASAVIEAGRLFLPMEAPWVAPFETELLLFPGGKYKDQVDALTQFLLWWDHSGPPELRIRLTTFPRKPTYYDRMGGSFP